MLPLVLLTATLGACELFQPVKCDSAVVEVRQVPSLNAPGYLLIPHQTGYFLFLRVQGDQVGVVYPENPAKQYPVEAGDTVRAWDETWDFRNREAGTGLVVLWSPQPIALSAYRAGSSWLDTALTNRWRVLVARGPQGTMAEHLKAFAIGLSDPLESIAQIASTPVAGRPDLPPGWDASIYPSGGLTAYQAAHPMAPIPGLPFGQNSCVGQSYPIPGSSGMGSGC